MAGDRRALLVAADRYDDPGLTRLRAPAGDVQALAGVLGDAAIGAFAVRPLVNCSTDETKQEIEGFFDDGRLNDLLLLYISGHGVLSQTRGLFFATSSTKLKRLRATAIEDTFVSDVMRHSRARSIVLVLDCCHSGAFGKGLVPKSPLGIDLPRRFEGRGRITLTASTALEYAFEESAAEARISAVGEPLPGSLFTRYLVDGLRTGDADLDRDGRVTLDELYDYVYARVREHSPNQTPGKSGSGHGDIVIASSPRRSAALPAEVNDAIYQALAHPWASIRVATVSELARLRRAADPSMAVAIEQALRHALNDDDATVTAAARAALQAPRDSARPVARPATETIPRTPPPVAPVAPVPPPRRTRRPAASVDGAPAIRAGHYVLGPRTATLRVKTGRHGAAAKAGHDLILEVREWAATLDLADEPASCSVEVWADPASLHVVEGVGGLQPLGDDDKADIRNTIRRDILTKAMIRFTSSSVAAAAGDLEVTGDLALAGTTRPVTFRLTVGAGSIAGVATVKQSDWKIKPYSALFGALRVNDEVAVEVDGRLA